MRYSAAIEQNRPVRKTPLNESRFQTIDQRLRLKGLAQEAYCASRHCTLAHGLFGKCSDEDGGDLNPLCGEMFMQLDATHRGHLNIGDQAIGVTEVDRFKEVLGRGEHTDEKTQGANEAVDAGADGVVVIDHGDHWRAGQTEYL